MKKLLTLLLFVLFIVNKNAIVLAAEDAINIWSKSLFPVLFPTLILSDILLASGLTSKIPKFFYDVYSKIFKTSPYGLFVFIVSIFGATPTNAKILKDLYDSKLIDKNSLTKILSQTIFFNPILILTFSNLKVLIIMWVSNVLTSFILRDALVSENPLKASYNFEFNLNKSIEKNMKTILNILGTLTVFLSLSNIVPIKNPIMKTFISGILEITSGFTRIKLYTVSPINDILMLTFTSLASFSIIMQIKSILKETKFDSKYFYTSRILTLFISLLIYFIT